MDELKYELLAEVSGRLEAEAIKSLLEAHEIPVELIQEAIGHLIYPVTVDGLGLVQIFVPRVNLEEAVAWLEIYRQGISEEEIE